MRACLLPTGLVALSATNYSARAADSSADFMNIDSKLQFSKRSWPGILPFSRQTKGFVRQSSRIDNVERGMLLKLYLRDEIPGCSHEKTKSVMPGNSLASRPSRGAKLNPRILNQNSVPNSPGFVLVT
jgi:hypothetical protein